MNTTDQRILLQLARRGLAAYSETIASPDGQRAWLAILALEEEFKRAMEAPAQIPKDTTNG